MFVVRIGTRVDLTGRRHELFLFAGCRQFRMTGSRLHSKQWNDQGQREPDFGCSAHAVHSAGLSVQIGVVRSSVYPGIIDLSDLAGKEEPSQRCQEPFPLP
jgi:hypothetical protein